MLEKIEKNSRGYFDHGWLKTFHTFSFADYYDPNRMGFSVLRVLNEDFVSPASGFPTHPHRNMEIITYVIKGAVKHKDSMGNETIIKAHEIQVMSAGSGITHSEFNPLNDEVLHLMQIWVTPKQMGITPRYAELNLSKLPESKHLTLIASESGENGSLLINQDAKIFAGILKAGTELELDLNQSRKYFLQNIFGEIQVENETLIGSDALKMSEISKQKMKSLTDVEFLFFDLP